MNSLSAAAPALPHSPPRAEQRLERSSVGSVQAKAAVSSFFDICHSLHESCLYIRTIDENKCPDRSLAPYTLLYTKIWSHELLCACTLNELSEINKRGEGGYEVSFFSPVEFLDAEVHHAVSIRHVSQLVHDRLVGQPVKVGPASSLVGPARPT